MLNNLCFVLFIIDNIPIMNKLSEIVYESFMNHLENYNVYYIEPKVLKGQDKAASVQVHLTHLTGTN